MSIKQKIVGDDYVYVVIPRYLAAAKPSNSLYSHSHCPSGSVHTLDIGSYLKTLRVEMKIVKTDRHRDGSFIYATPQNWGEKRIKRFLK